MQQSKNKSRRLVGLLIGAIVLIGLIAGCGNNNAKNENENENGQAQGGGSEVVAKYEGGEVTSAQFEKYRSVMKVLFGDMYTQLAMMDPNFDKTILSQQIGISILSERATEEQKNEAKEQAKSDWDEYLEAMEEAGRSEELQKTLDTEGLTDEDLISFVEKEMASIFYYRDQVKDEEVQTYYDDMLESNENAFDRATVRHILVQTMDPMTQEEVRTDEEALARAEEVREKLQNGQTFDELAEQYSDDPGSAQNGGLYEDMNVNNWVENFKKAAIELPIDEISEPVKTDYGYHVMKVEERRTVGVDEMKEDIQMTIAQEEYQRFMTEELPELMDEESINLPKQETEKE